MKESGQNKKHSEFLNKLSSTKKQKPFTIFTLCLIPIIHFSLNTSVSEGPGPAVRSAYVNASVSV